LFLPVQIFCAATGKARNTEEKKSKKAPPGAQLPYKRKRQDPDIHKEQTQRKIPKRNAEKPPQGSSLSSR